MALKIWQTDPDNKPKARAAAQSYGDTVGTFTIGKSVENDKGKMEPVALSEFRVMTASREVADAVAQLYGGAPEETDSPSEEFIEVLTNASTVPVIIDGPAGYRSDLKQWVRGKLVHHCDGAVFLSHLTNPDLIGQPCRCPELFSERKDAARNEMGPKPAIEVFFRLADDPDLGKFKLKTGSWSLAAVEHEILGALEAIGGEALAEIGVEEVSFTAKSGPMKGKVVSFMKPTIKIVKPWAAAIADAPN